MRLQPLDGLDELRDKLIAALHSDKAARAYLSDQLSRPEFAGALVQVCLPYDYYTNDPRMEAAHYLSKCPIEALEAVAPQIEDLLRLPYDGELLDGNIGTHLVKCMERLTNEAGYVPSADIPRILGELAS